MGIPGFQKWLLGSFPEIVRVQGSRFGQVYDHVAFDMNQIIHQAARRATDRQSLAVAIFRELDRILKNCVPRKSIFLAFDGPGPLAKLFTQRKRRNKAKKGHTVENATGSSSRSKYAKPTIDRLEFTPGVELLYFVRDATEYWAYSRLQNDRKYRYVDIRISGADVAGEGELKLIDFCRAAHLPSTDSIVVIGGDADIVLQGLATIPIRNFFVYLHHFAGSGGKKVNYVVSVWELARTLERKFPEESSGVRIDFILFSILNGNDYVPKIRGVTLKRLWHRYLQLKTARDGSVPPYEGQCVVDAEKRTFNWPLFHALIDDVGVPVRPLEAEMQSQREIREEGEVPQNVSGRDRTRVHLEDSDEDIGEIIVYTGNEDGVPMHEQEGYSDMFYGACDPESMEGQEEMESDDVDDESLDDDGLEDEDIDEDKNHIENLVAISGNEKHFYDTERWFRTLLWTLHMYIDGYCSDFTFQYGKPYGPSCQVLAKYINEHNGDPFVLQAPVSNATPLLPHQAAVAMLPRHAAHLLPKPLRKLVEDPILSKRIFQANDVVNIPAMLQAIDEVPQSEYSRSEHKRMISGTPFLLRRPRHNDRPGQANPIVPRPGPKFEPISGHPIIYRKVFSVTASPPCYAWPRGAIRNMLDLPYTRVGGTQLRRPPRQQEPQAAGAKKRSWKTVNPRSGSRGPALRLKRTGREVQTRGRGRRQGQDVRGQSSRPGFRARAEEF